MGGNLVTIEGTDFRLPDPPPDTGIAPTPGPTVQVTFGGVLSPKVVVVAADRIFAVAPKGVLHDAQGRPIVELAVDVEVSNLDNTGVIIPGEVATSTNAYTFTRPDLSHNNPTGLTRLIRQIIRSIKSEVTPNVSWTHDADYDDDTSTPEPTSTKLPAVSLIGPELTENIFYREAGGSVDVYDLDGAAVSGEFFIVENTHYDDVKFDIVAYSDDPSEFGNLMAVLLEWVDRNRFLFFECAPGEFFRLNFDFIPDGQFKTEKQQGTALNSNLLVTRGQVVVEAFPRLALPGVPNDRAIDVGAPVAEDGPTLLSTDNTSDTLPASTYGRRSPPPSGQH